MRLHVQLAIAGGVLLAVTISVVTWMNIQTMRQELIENTARETTALAKSLSIISTHLVLTNKYDELESLLVQSAAFPGITDLKILTADGQVLSQVKKLESGEIIGIYDLLPVEIPENKDLKAVVNIDWQANRLTTLHPIATSSLIGWVEMQVSLNEMIVIQKETIADSIKGATTAILIDIFIIVLILYRPARNLREVVKFAGTLVDKPGTQIDFHGSSLELDKLIKALNESSTKLQIQQSQIFRKTKMLKRMASIDQLTKIPNRSIFMDRLENAIKLAKRNSAELVVIFIDLNDFKPVNDNYGHQIGDILLVQFADRLTSCIRESDSLARYGGDEFILMLTNVTGKARLTEIVANLRRTVSAPYEIKDKQIEISVSIGLAAYPADGSDSDELLTVADHNMYKEKREYKRKKA